VDTTAASPTGSTCVYADNGSYTLRLTVSDGIEATDTATATVLVNNVAPTYTSPPNQSSFAGNATAFLLGSFTDPGAEAGWTITVNWGDSSAPSELTITTTGRLPTASHSYVSAGTFNVVVTVNDGEEEDLGGFQVVVNPATVGSIAGVVFADTNANGTQEGDEPGVAGAELTLQSIQQTGSLNTSQIRTVVTDATGNYTFNNLPPDAYTLSLTPPSGYVMLGDASVSLTVQAGQITTAPTFTLWAESSGTSVLHLPAVQKP
jgi:hypothetical protein